MRYNKKMILFMKKHIEKVLIAAGTIVIMLSIVYTLLNSISIVHTWEGFMGVALSYAMLVPGMWIASEKMKEKIKTLSVFIKVFTIIQCVAFLRFSIAFLFNF